MTREYTNRVLDAIEEGLLGRDQVILACLNYMSEQEVKDMCEDNLFFEEEEEEEEMPEDED